jgi:xanthosine utilization system XapX-like protein
MLVSMARRTRSDLTGESFRLAVLAGLASAPFTIALSWDLVRDEVEVAGGTVGGIPILVAGLIVGVLYSGRAVESRRAGTVAGVAASVGIGVLYLANTVTTVLSEPPGVAAIAVLATPVLLLLGVALSALVGLVGALVGDWIAQHGARLLSARDAQ